MNGWQLWFLTVHDIPPSIRSGALSRQPSLILFSLDVMFAFSSMFFAVVAIALFSAVAAFAQATPPPAFSRAKALAIYAPRPGIPLEARVKHLRGAGVCMVYVRPDGIVSRAEMLQSTGQPILDKASIDAFSKWRFKPGTVTKVKIPIRYTGNYPKY